MDRCGGRRDCHSSTTGPSASRARLPADHGPGGFVSKTGARRRFGLDRLSARRTAGRTHFTDRRRLQPSSMQVAISPVSDAERFVSRTTDPPDLLNPPGEGARAVTSPGRPIAAAAAPRSAPDRRDMSSGDSMGPSLQPPVSPGPPLSSLQTASGRSHFADSRLSQEPATAGTEFRRMCSNKNLLTSWPHVDAPGNPPPVEPVSRRSLASIPECVKVPSMKAGDPPT